MLLDEVNNGHLNTLYDFQTRLYKIGKNNDLYRLILLKNEKGENALQIASRLRDSYFYEAFTLNNIDAIDVYEMFENIVHLFGEIIYLHSKSHSNSLI